MSMGNKIIYVSKIDDLPTPVGNVITIPDGSTIFILGDLDLKGNRIVADGVLCIQGTSSETSFLYSTGLPTGESLITSSRSLPVFAITFGCPEGCSVFDLESDGSNGIDMAFTNFGSDTLVCGNIGTISNYSNFILFSCAALNIKNGIHFDGTIGTIAINQSLFTSEMDGTNAHLNLLPGLEVTRRFRVTYSSIVTLGSNIGINVDALTTLPTEGFILDTVNFSGPGTPLQGISEVDNEALITLSTGVENTRVQGGMSMFGNSTQTTITLTDTYYKVSGTTSALSTNQKFSHENNRLTYIGAFKAFFFFSINLSVSTGNNVFVHAAIFKNGTIISSSETSIQADGNGDFDSMKVQCLEELDPNDYVELYVGNFSSTVNILVQDLNFILFRLT